MNKKIFVLFFAFLSIETFAQTTTGGWIEFYPDMYTKNGKWRFTPEVDYRINNFKGSQSFLFRPQATYFINKHFTGEVGGWYTLSWDDFTANKDEIGIYQQINMKTPSWHRFSIGIRIRQEEIFSKDSNADEFNFGARIRFRPHIRYSLPVWKEKKPYIEALVETLNFWNNKEHFADAFWIGGRAGFSPTKRLTFIFEYNYAYNYKIMSPTSYAQRVRFFFRYRIF
ncbi:MAG: DUF2490 domain-containing protein [Flavobacteriales bacterium]|nr:DUF2490 domain-containing protein [Flavobacteriales bacterium]